MTKILLIGSGAREHAIARALYNSQAEIWSVIDKKNPGIMAVSSRTFTGEKQPENWIDDVSPNVDAAIIGPEAPLALGIADILEDHDIPTIGPQKKVARIETSKEFSRVLMKTYDIPGRPEFRICTRIKHVETALEELGNEVAIKPDGLTGGKGVWVHGDHFTTQEEAIKYAKTILESHGSLVIEEKLQGTEFTAQFLCNGTKAIPFPLVRDYKRAYNNDKGPNTGSMGSISYPNHSLPYITPEDQQIIQNIADQTLTALKLETRTTYKGILYVQAMKTKNHQIKVIEYNARFGDPEAINVLSTINTSFTDAILLASQGQTPKLTFHELATTCVYLTPKGYPKNPQANQLITIPKTIPQDTIYYGSVNQTPQGLRTTTSRAIGILGKAPTLQQARKQAYQVIKQIQGDLHYRTDIGTRTQ